jgi:putative ABC transport system permease protein
MIFALAWRNIWRQPIRTSLSLVGMAFTSMLLVFMLSFQFGSYDTMKSSMLRISDGYGQFQPVGYKDDPEISKVIANPDTLLTEVRAVRGITAATPRTVGFVLLANGDRSFAAAISGIDPVEEAKVSTLSSSVKQGRSLTADDDAAIVLGDGLARNLRLSVGDQVTMLGSGMDGSVAADVLTLVGIFKSGVPEIDRQIAQMPISRFKDSFLMDGAVNVVALTGEHLSDVEAVGKTLRAIAADHNAVYLDWTEIQPA